jgi:hypothetical protein
MVVVIVMVEFTLVQSDDAILGPALTSLNTGPCTHYFIAIYK